MHGTHTQYTCYTHTLHKLARLYTQATHTYATHTRLYTLANILHTHTCYTHTHLHTRHTQTHTRLNKSKVCLSHGDRSYWLMSAVCGRQVAWCASDRGWEAAGIRRGQEALLRGRILQEPVHEEVYMLFVCLIHFFTHYYMGSWVTWVLTWVLGERGGLDPKNKASPWVCVGLRCRVGRFVIQPEPVYSALACCGGRRPSVVPRAPADVLSSADDSSLEQ